MPSRKVDRIASAVLRQIRPPRGRPPASFRGAVASVSAPRTARRRGPKPLDLLAAKLASAVSQRLAAGPAAAQGRPLVASRLASGVVRNVTRQLGTKPGPEPIALSSIDPAAAAKALTEALTSDRLGATDPAAIVASTMLRRLSGIRLTGTPAEAREFQSRVASIVTAALRPAPAAAAAAAEAEAVPPEAAAAPPETAEIEVTGEAETATAGAAGRKRS